MTSRISHTSFDAIDAHAQSVFWSKVLGFVEDPDDPTGFRSDHVKPRAVARA